MTLGRPGARLPRSSERWRKAFPLGAGIANMARSRCTPQLPEHAPLEFPLAEVREVQTLHFSSHGTRITIAAS